MKKKVAQEPEPNTIPVVRSAFRVLEQLSKAGALGLNEATVRTAVSKSTVFRDLTTLSRMGHVAEDHGRQHYITHALANLVSEGASMEALEKVALPWMSKLRDEFGETVNLGPLVLDKIVHVEVVPGEFALRPHERPGATVPFHCSALGKAILAFSPKELVEGLVTGRDLPMLTRNTITEPEQFLWELRRVRSKGFAMDRGEVSLLAAVADISRQIGAQSTAADVPRRTSAKRVNKAKAQPEPWTPSRRSS